MNAGSSNENDMWKTLRDGGLLRDRTGVEVTGNHLGETTLRWLGHLERMDETNLVKRVLGYIERKAEKIMG